MNNLIVAIVMGLDALIHPKTNQELFKVSVMITNMAENSGGSGVILQSEQDHSLILTNKHVCEGIGPEGVVHDSGHKKHMINSMMLDSRHDLCLIRVAGDLQIDVVLASKAPQPADDLVIVGHPRLLPTIITKGHFSDTTIISVLDGDNVVLREAVVASALISPGSSGSPVFNTKGELAGMVFAGFGNLSYGFLVPVDYIRSFVSIAYLENFNI
jgi:S1-C subfamily serine protease